MFIPQNLTPQEHSATAGQHGQSGLATSLLFFAGGNGGAVNFAPPTSRIEGTNEGSPASAIHNRSVQSPANETDAGGIQEVLSLLQSLLQALLRLLGGNNSNDGGGGSGSSSGESGGRSSPSGSHNSHTPQNLAAQPGNGAPKTQASDGAASTANIGNGPKGMPQELWKDCVNAGNKFGVDPFVLAAQSKQESNFGKDLSGASGGDGVMQVEPSTRAAYTGQFQERMGHAYNHGRQSDQVAMAALIMGSKSGGTTAQLQKYNGGDNWKPGATDSYGRVIKANEYAASVKNIAQQLRNSVA